MSTSTKVFRRECLLLARTTEATPTSSAFQLAGNGSAPRGLGSPTTAGFAALLSQAHGSREGQGRPPQAWTLAQGLLAPAAPQDGGARDPPSATPATALCRLPEQRRAQKSHHARLSRDGWPYYSACLLAPHVLQIPESLQFSKQLPWWCSSFFFLSLLFSIIVLGSQLDTKQCTSQRLSSSASTGLSPAVQELPASGRTMASCRPMLPTVTPPEKKIHGSQERI